MYLYPVKWVGMCKEEEENDMTSDARDLSCYRILKTSAVNASVHRTKISRGKSTNKMFLSKTGMLKWCVTTLPWASCQSVNVICCFFFQ